MGCKASTIRDENTSKAAHENTSKAATPKALRKSASPIREVRTATPKALSPKALTPKEEMAAEQQEITPVFKSISPEPTILVENIVLEEKTEIAEVVVEEPVVEIAAEPIQEVTAAPVVEAAPIVAAAPVAQDPKPKKRRNSKKAPVAPVLDTENVAPVAKKQPVETQPAKRAFGQTIVNISSPVQDVTPVKKAVTFTSTTESFEKKMATPIVSRKAKKNVGLRSQSGKSNMQMDVYLQQCAAFERLLTNANTFEKQMNTR